MLQQIRYNNIVWLTVVKLWIGILVMYPDSTEPRPRQYSVVARRGQTLHFTLLENFLPKYKICNWKSPILGKFRSKIEILNTHTYSVRNLMVPVRKLQLPAPSFLIHDSAGLRHCWNCFQHCFWSLMTLDAFPVYWMILWCDYCIASIIICSSWYFKWWHFLHCFTVLFVLEYICHAWHPVFYQTVVERDR